MLQTRVAPAVPQARAGDADHGARSSPAPRTGSTGLGWRSASCSARCCRRPTRCSPPRGHEPARAAARAPLAQPRVGAQRRARAAGRARVHRRAADRRGGLRVVAVRAAGRHARVRLRHRDRAASQADAARARAAGSIPDHPQSLYALGAAFATYGIAVGLPLEGNGLIAVFVVRDHARDPAPRPARDVRGPRRRHRGDRQARHVRRVRRAADARRAVRRRLGGGRDRRASRCWWRARSAIWIALVGHRRVDTATKALHGLVRPQGRGDDDVLAARARPRAIPAASGSSTSPRCACSPRSSPTG